MSTVQVVIPCYNYGRYLRDCVMSALSQEGVDVRVLIIDDCSKDNSPEVGRKLESEDSRVRFIRHEVNKGHIATYNEGLMQASSDYVVLLSADDLLAPGALQRAANLMDKNPSVGLVYGHALTFQEEAPKSFRTKVSGWTIWSGADWIERMCQTGRNCIMCPEVVMRTSVQHEIGGYRAELPHSGDMEMWLRAAAVSDVGRVRGTDQACYRTHPLSMQRTIHAGMLFDLNGRLQAFQSAFSSQAGRLPQADRLFAEAKRALSRTAIRHALRSIKCDVRLDSPIEAYEKFANDLDPDVVTTREWRALQRARKQSRAPLSTFLARQINFARAVIVWILWRHFGVHHFIQ